MMPGQLDCRILVTALADGGRGAANATARSPASSIFALENKTPPKFGGVLPFGQYRSGAGQAAFCSVTCGCAVSTVVPILIVRTLAASGTSRTTSTLIKPLSRL